MHFSELTSGTPPEVFPLEKEAKSKGKSPTKTWKEVSSTKARLKLMRNMKNEAQGFNHDENFVRKMKSQARVSNFQGKGEKKVIKMILGLKIEDQRKELRRLKEEKNEARKELVRKFGKGTMKLRKALKRLNEASRVNEEEEQERFAGKFNHLKRKHDEARKQRDGAYRKFNTRWKEVYAGVNIYKEEEDPEGFQELLKEVDREQQQELAAIRCIGEGVLTTPEKKVLRLPPGTSVNPKLSEDTFKCENEILNVKLRYEQRKWEEQDADFQDGIENYLWKDLEEAEKVRRAEEEASLRQIFDPINGILDFGKKRVTDSSLNSFIKMPKELSNDRETYLNLRRSRYTSVLQAEIDRLEGRTPRNLPRAETEGLTSLQEKVKDGELVIAKTDKSGKLAPCTPEAYIEMGKVHFKKDEEVDIGRLLEVSKEVAAHTSIWLKMFRVGEAHGQVDRFRKSLIGGDTPAPLYVLVKDHKAMESNGLPKTRPVVSGCSSYNVGMSELCSEVLEATFKNMRERVGVISSDDFLSKLHKLNCTIKDEALMIYNPEDEAHVQGSDKVIMMIASDVVALFPSMKAEETAYICGQMIERSELQVNNLDYTEMLLYIQLNRSKVRKLSYIENFLPVRKRKGGKEPSMKNDQIRGPWRQTEVEEDKLFWIHREPPQSEAAKRKILALVVEIGIQELF